MPELMSTLLLVLLCHIVGALFLSYSLTPPVDFSMKVDNTKSVPSMAAIAAAVAAERNEDRFSNIVSCSLLSGAFLSGAGLGQMVASAAGAAGHERAAALFGGVLGVVLFFVVAVPLSLRIISSLRKRRPVSSNW